MEYFLNLFLFENYGAFVLLGSKPISDMTLIDIENAEMLWQKKLAVMTNEEKVKWEQLLKDMEEKGNIANPGFLRNPFKGWLVLKKLDQMFERKRFLFLIRSQGSESAFYDLLFVDILKTAAVLAEHYDYFKKIVQMDFDPITIVYELENERSPFWEKIFQLENHIAKGLIFGYGKKNAALFYWYSKHLKEEQPISKKIITIPTSSSMQKGISLGQGNLSNFTIPPFGFIEDENVRKYYKEKQEIIEYYQGKNLIEATLEKLFD